MAAQAQRSTSPSSLETPQRVLKYDRPWMAPYQEAAIFNPKDLNGQPARYSIIEATTKAGKTAGCLVWLIEEAMQGKSGDNYWWVAPINTQADIAFVRARDGLPPFVYTTDLTHKTLRLANGTTLWFKSADNPDSLYGDDVRAAVIDEASRVKEEAFHAVRTTLTATRGKLRVIGNVKGRKNWFYRMARTAESGSAGMSYHKMTAHDAVAAGIIAQEEVEDARKLLPPQVFKELYLAEPSDDGGNPFGLAAIAKCIAPLSGKRPKVWGWDLAKSQDWTVGIALDEDGMVCRFYRWQRPWVETIRDIKLATGSGKALVDSTGVGDPVLEHLQRDGGTNYEGFNFSPSSKQKLMEGLAVKIQSQAIKFPDGPIRKEMEEFEYEYTRTGVRYSAPEGLHDDCVMALALAAMHQLHARPSVKIQSSTLERARIRVPGMGVSLRL